MYTSYYTPASSRSLLFFLSSSFASDHLVTYLLPTQRGNSNTIIFLRVNMLNITTSGSLSLYVSRFSKNHSCEKSRHEAMAVCHVHVRNRKQATINPQLITNGPYHKCGQDLVLSSQKTLQRNRKLIPKDYNSSPNKFALKINNDIIEAIEVLGGLTFHHMTSEGKPSVHTKIGPFTQCHVYLHVHVCQSLGLNC